MQKYRVAFSELDWESPMQGVRHKVIVDGDKKLRLVEYLAEMAPHWCERGHRGYLLEGRFEIEFESDTLIFEQGDGILIPDGTVYKHRARVLTDVVRAIFVENA